MATAEPVGRLAPSVSRQQAQAPRRLYGSIDGVQVPVGQEWRELKLGCWYRVEAVSQRQWPSRFKERIGQLEALKATDIRVVPI